jgi:hypothetical protein
MKKLSIKIIFLFLCILFSTNLFGQVVEDRPIKLIVSDNAICNGNKNSDCLLVKGFDNNIFETVRIKKFDYDDRYIYTIIAKVINDGYYKYQHLTTTNKKLKDTSGGGQIPTYQIIIEKDGFDVKDYVKYRVEGTNDTIQFPIDHFIGIDLIPNTRYVLKVKEVEKNDQTYLELAVQLEPGKIQKFDTLFVSSQTVPCSNNTTIQCLQIKTTDGLNLTNISNIKSFDYEKGYKYKLQVQKIKTFEYVLAEVLSKEEDLPCPNPPPTVFYDCDDIENRIATCNEVIYTNFMLEDDNSIKIRPVDQDIPFYKFYGNICGFSFIEDHKYTLEVKKDGNDYILVKILCDEKKNILPNSNEKIFTDCGSKSKLQNQPDDKNRKKEDSIPEIPKPRYNIKELDSAVWYLRYLFQTDSLQPINDLADTSYFFTTDISLDKINITTPCETYEDKLRSYEIKSFKYESRTVSGKRCDSTTKLLFEQLRNVNHYEISDNKLKLSVYNNDLQDAKVLIVLEGVPKKK